MRRFFRSVYLSSVFGQVEVAEAVFVEVWHHIVCNLLELASFLFLLVETNQTLDSLLSDILEGI